MIKNVTSPRVREGGLSGLFPVTLPWTAGRLLSCQPGKKRGTAVCEFPAALARWRWTKNTRSTAPIYTEAPQIPPSLPPSKALWKRVQLNKSRMEVIATSAKWTVRLTAASHTLSMLSMETNFSWCSAILFLFFRCPYTRWLQVYWRILGE